MKQLLLGLTLLLILAACNVPFLGDEAPEPEPTEPEAPAPEATEPEEIEQVEPTMVPEPTQEPLGDPILPVQTGQQILITNIQMVSDSQGWAIGGLEGASDHVFRSGDGGRTWNDVTPREPAPQEGDPRKIAVGYFLNASHGWVTYYADTAEPINQRLRVWATQDGGNSWTPSRPIELEFFGTGDYPPLLGFEDTSSGWLVARNGPAGMHRYPIYLLRTTDGGLNWEMAITPAEGGLQSCRKSGMEFADLTIGWATLADCPVPAPELATTNDGGRSWTALPLPAPEKRPDLFDTDICEGHSPQLISPTHGALAVSCTTGLKLNFVYITRDGGLTWSAHVYPGGELILLNQRTAYAVGGQKIYQSIDGGQNWEWVKTVQWDGQFSFVSDLVGWAVARTGEAFALVNTTDGALTWGLIKPQIAP
jgi:photosystem II stability/assembly factor-like uncharacterized protein